MAFQDDYQRSVVPGGVLAFVPKTAVPAGDTIGITPSHRFDWMTILNTGEVELLLCVSEQAFTDSVGLPIAVSGGITLSAAEAARRIVIGAKGGSAGEVAAVLSLSRSPIEDNYPELTTGSGFPAFDDSDADNIVPGVGLAT
jgi:hypothetical protein